MKMNGRIAWMARASGLALFLAKAALATGFLSLESSPTGAEVWYTGPEDPDKKYLGDTPLQNREMPTGRYNVWLILPSHDTLAIPDVYIAEGQVTQVNREIPTHYGYLEVTTDPDSSELWLDGVDLGAAPHVNNLVLPGSYKLKAIPRESHFKNSARNILMNKGDTIRLAIQAPYRDKSFLQENLSLPAWRLQLEAGVQFRSITADYDDSSKRVKRATDSIASQWDFPVQARLGLPQGFEIHMLLPFKNFQSKMDSTAPFASDMRFGVKYTYRPLNVGFDVSYGLGIKKSSVALSHDILALTLMGMASKGKITGEAQAGFEFHLTDKIDNKFDPGDEIAAHAQLGYLLDPLLPYLGLTGRFHLDGDHNGVSDKSSGYLLIPEPGLIIDVADLLSLQFGVPFTIVGKSNHGFWGLHLSMSLGFGLK
jgi:hypothetical protein